MADEYRRFRIASSEATEREWLLAEAFEAGAEGAEESEVDGRFCACIYAPADRVESIRLGLRALASAATEIDPAEPLPDVDWSEAWKEGLEAFRVSQRLVIRPPFIESPLEPGQREIVIDPGQAFGTGSHASTRLCLEWIDALVGEPASPAPGPGSAPMRSMGRVLDVGTGSGVLALAAVALGAHSAVGFDLDPVAIEAAQVAARDNDLADRVHFFTGPIEALSPAESRYPLVLANLLKREMLPIATALADRVAEGGSLVLAGLLEEDVPEVLARFEVEGLVETGRREQADSVGLWIGLRLGHR